MARTTPNSEAAARAAANAPAARELSPALPDAVERELMHLRSIVGLAAFAVEARRVLREIDVLAALVPSACSALSTIEARRQWGEYPDTTAQVLSDVHDRLDALLGDVAASADGRA